MRERKLLEDGSIITDFKIKSDSEKALKHAVDLCFVRAKEFLYFTKDGGKLKLYRSDYGAKKDGGVLLPYKLTSENAYSFIYAWLHSLTAEEIRYEYENGDGSHRLGFEMEWLDFGENPDVVFEAIHIYYSK